MVLRILSMSLMKGLKGGESIECEFYQLLWFPDHTKWPIFLHHVHSSNTSQCQLASMSAHIKGRPPNQFSLIPRILILSALISSMFLYMDMPHCYCMVNFIFSFPFLVPWHMINTHICSISILYCKLVTSLCQ